MIYLESMGQAIAPTMLRAGRHIVHSRGDGLSSPWSPRNNRARTRKRNLHSFLPSLLLYCVRLKL